MNSPMLIDAMYETEMWLINRLLEEEAFYWRKAWESFHRGPPGMFLTDLALAMRGVGGEHFLGLIRRMP